MKSSRAFALLAATTFAVSTFAKSEQRSEQAVRITGSTPAASGLDEERLIGETARPEWTSARRFAGTRIFIQK